MTNFPKTKNILRIKVNNFNLLKLSLINGIDFNFSYPKSNVAEQISDSHFSLHTRNDKITFKIISVKKHGIEVLPYVLELAKTNPSMASKIIPIGQLDLLKGKLFDFSNPNLLVRAPIGIALNIKDIKIEDLFINKVSKSPDSTFLSVKEVRIPPDKNAFKFECLIGKNFIGNIGEYTKDTDEFCIVQEKNILGNVYTFLFIMKYQFPSIASSPSSIRI